MNVATVLQLLQTREAEPFKSKRHQVVGAHGLVHQRFCLLADDMGLGKTKQAINGAQILCFDLDMIDRVIVMAPAAVRSVWFGQLGELRKHLWAGYPSIVRELHARVREWSNVEGIPKKRLEWAITNYEFVRSKARLKQVKALATKRTLLILDESTAVKNHKAAQTKAAKEIRNSCGFVWLLNGTPIAESPLDMFSQGNIMHHSILDCPYVTYFKAHYTIQEPILSHGGKALTDPRGHVIQKIAGWKNLDELQRRFAPYIIRRRKADCLDLPPKLPSVVIEVPLSKETWNRYKEMRDEMVTWLNNSAFMAPQVIVQMIRLQQIVSGFIGGRPETFEAPEDETPPGWMTLDTAQDVFVEDRALPFAEIRADGPKAQAHLQGALPLSSTIIRPDGAQHLEFFGTERRDAFLDWLAVRLEEQPNFKFLVWCRFREEVAQLVDGIIDFPRMSVAKLVGGQKRDERERAIAMLDPRTMPKGPAGVVGTVQTGGVGLTLVGASTVVYYSNDRRRYLRVQSEDRVHRPGQTSPVSYFDFVAVGPKGQKTIDHIILKSIQEKDELANWTASRWISELTDDA